MSVMNEEEGHQFGVYGNGVFRKIELLDIPVIAAVNGFALGGGCELALTSDYIVASEKAKFGQPEAGLGITPGFGGTQRLPRKIGVSKAKELIFSARVISAQEAYELGIVDKLVAPEELMDKVMEIMASFTKNAPIAVANCKKRLSTKAISLTSTAASGPRASGSASASQQRIRRKAWAHSLRRDLQNSRTNNI